MTDNLLEILRKIQNTEIGEPMPPCLRQPGDKDGRSIIDWATPPSPYQVRIDTTRDTP